MTQLTAARDYAQQHNLSYVVLPTTDEFDKPELFVNGFRDQSEDEFSRVSVDKKSLFAVLRQALLRVEAASRLELAFDDALRRKRQAMLDCDKAALRMAEAWAEDLPETGTAIHSSLAGASSGTGLSATIRVIKRVEVTIGYLLHRAADATFPEEDRELIERDLMLLRLAVLPA